MKNTDLKTSVTGSDCHFFLTLYLFTLPPSLSPAPPLACPMHLHIVLLTQTLYTPTQPNTPSASLRLLSPLRTPDSTLYLQCSMHSERCDCWMGAWLAGGGTSPLFCTLSIYRSNKRPTRKQQAPLHDSVCFRRIIPRAPWCTAAFCFIKLLTGCSV